METKNYKTTFVDVFSMAYVGGSGTFEEVAADFAKAVEEYNERNGTRLILEMSVD